MKEDSGEVAEIPIGFGFTGVITNARGPCGMRHCPIPEGGTYTLEQCSLEVCLRYGQIRAIRSGAVHSVTTGSPMPSG